MKYIQLVFVSEIFRIVGCVCKKIIKKQKQTGNNKVLFCYFFIFIGRIKLRNIYIQKIHICFFAGIFFHWEIILIYLESKIFFNFALGYRIETEKMDYRKIERLSELTCIFARYCSAKENKFAESFNLTPSELRLLKFISFANNKKFYTLKECKKEFMSYLRSDNPNNKFIGEKEFD